MLVAFVLNEKILTFVRELSAIACCVNIDGFSEIYLRYANLFTPAQTAKLASQLKLKMNWIHRRPCAPFRFVMSHTLLFLLAFQLPITSFYFFLLILFMFAPNDCVMHPHTLILKNLLPDYLDRHTDARNRSSQKRNAKLMTNAQCGGHQRRRQRQQSQIRRYLFIAVFFFFTIICGFVRSLVSSVSLRFRFRPT